jgi:hypothetical protein
MAGLPESAPSGDRHRRQAVPRRVAAPSPANRWRSFRSARPGQWRRASSADRPRASCPPCQGRTQPGRNRDRDAMTARPMVPSPFRCRLGFPRCLRRAWPKVPPGGQILEPSPRRGRRALTIGGSTKRPEIGRSDAFMLLPLQSLSLRFASSRSLG